MARTSSLTATRSSPLLLTWIALILSIAILYFAREVLIPLALATLLSFLLTPLTKGLERLRLGRCPAVLIAMALALCSLTGMGWIVSTQLLDVINQLPAYKENIQRKIESIRGSKDGMLTKTTNSVQELTKELTTTPPNQPAPALRIPAKTAKSASPPTSGVRPVAVELMEPPPSALQALRNLVGPLLGPLGRVLMVIVFTIFMLMRREDARNRLIRLIAKGHLNVMTQAMDDAARRVSRYLLMQFIVNAAFGALVATGLYFIGVPNALLWGAVAAALRFVPYLGPLIAGAFPFLLALAVFNDWRRPLLTVGLFLGIELIISNVVEPWLYGAHTGISSLAILVAAVFWTVLWGPVGLILSTPLTVCLLVMGRYVPQLEFLDILLGDEPVLTPEAQFYQRLLAMDQREAQAVSETFLKGKPLIDLFDEVMIPALAMAEQDRHQGLLEATREAFIAQSINEMIVEFANYTPDVALEDEAPRRITEIRSDARVFCLPANDQADEITATMLAQVLEQAGYPTIALGVTDSPMDVLDEVNHGAGDIVCICALPPFAILNARTLSKRLRARFSEIKIVVGLWNLPEDGARAQDTLGRAFVDTVVTTLKQALEEVDALAHSPEVLSKLDHPVAT